jgi:hypothetical protein
MVVQYLQDSGYTASALTIQDEANVKMYEELEQRVQLKAMRKAILGSHIPIITCCLPALT